MSARPIRTWRLTDAEAECARYGEAVGELIGANEDVPVIELEPVLDLLERSTGGTDVAVFDGREIIDLLREHGRLQ